MDRALNTLNYTIEVDRLDKWDKVVSFFDDSNIYQTYAYAKVCYGGKNTSTLLVQKDNYYIAASLVRIHKVPVLPLGIAYIFWGPLWKNNGVLNFENYAHGIHALIKEYAINRGLVLRVKPFLYEDENSKQFDHILCSAGFRPLLNLPRQKTLLIDLKKPVEELRAGLNGKWRGHLNRAEKNSLTIIEGTDDKLFDLFQPVHEELQEKKQISGVKSIEIYKNIQLQLPNPLKMRIFLCEHLGIICAGIIVSAIGNVGITLARATSELGRNQKAAYLLQWRALKWLKNEGCHLYDLSGVNKISNPGTYSYKAGFCGKNGKEMKMMPQYQICKGKLKEIMVGITERGIRSIRR